MISKIKFSELLQNEIGESLDRHFAKNGWALQRWDDGQEVGYQVYFGKGEQVDNHYEYALSLCLCSPPAPLQYVHLELNVGF